MSQGPTTIDSNHTIPDATITCQIALSDEYTIDEAQAALVQIAKCLNRLVGVALTKGSLSVANPITQAVIAASGNCETAAVHIAQMRQQQREQSGIVSPSMMPGPMPIRGRSN